jgi:predicted TIM-barrel fold metal-dependent hydrolase
MKIKHGVISADSHFLLTPDAMTNRMSSKWGSKIPHVVEVEEDGRRVDKWTVYDGAPRGNVANCPAVMGEPYPHFADKWEEVPAIAFEPLERLKALDEDKVDGEVLFPNAPFGTFYQFKDKDFELDAMRACNDALAEWGQASDRYLPLAGVPYLSGPEGVASEIERCAKMGHRGVNLMAEFPETIPHMADPAWDSVWDICESAGLPINFHGSAGVRAGGEARQWKGYNERIGHSAMTASSAVTPGQIIPHFVFSGITDKFPDLRVVFAEAGVGGFNYMLSACDHEWETRHLWTEGIKDRPSVAIHRQMFVNFWFEVQGMRLRDEIGIDNIMWESDYPHVASYYPFSQESIDKVIGGVTGEDREKMLYKNAVHVYRIDTTN